MHDLGSRLLALAICAALPGVGCLGDERLQRTQQEIEQLTVQSTANIFGAGHASPPSPGGGGAGTLPPSVAVAGDVVTFPSITGMISCCGAGGLAPADGGPYASGNTDILSYQGISGIRHSGKTMFLVGVFLDDAQPADPAPERLDVSDWNQQTSFAPALRQTFFIGDGLSSAGDVQSFAVPAGATRLFLGFADALDFGNPTSYPGYYHDNMGSLSVSVQTSDTVTMPPAPVVGPLVDLFNEGCSLIRDSEGHADQRASQRGADYQISAEQLGDPLTRDRANMARRVVRALASGTVVDVVRLPGNENRTSVVPSGLAVQAAEEQGILINVLSEDATHYLLIQYVHVFPTFDWVRQGGGDLDLPSIVEYDRFSADDVAAFRGDRNRKSYNYVHLPTTFNGRVSNGEAVQAGDELGFYAQIGKSTLPEGPHVHVSMFTRRKDAPGNLTSWLNNPSSSALGGELLQPEDYIPCSP